MAAVRKRRKDSGYALILVLLMASAIAITLYKEIPRVAFESQRQKELLLIERGEQYTRAIKVFVRETKGRYPARIEELESFNNRRFLRSRYKDPMTGKDEWRLIHIQNGMLTDSKTRTQNQQAQQQGGSTSNYVSEHANFNLGTTGTGQASGANLAMRRRDSDNSPAGLPDLTPGPAPGSNPSQPPSTPAPGQPPVMGIPGGVPNMPVQVGLGQPGQTLPGQPVQGPGMALPAQGGILPPGSAGTLGQPGGPGQIPLPGGFPGQGQQPGAQPGQQPGSTGYTYIGGSNYIGGSATPAGGQQPQNQQPGTNPALGMIQNILTTPRPGGAPTTLGGNQVMGGGIAGIASTVDMEGIIVYKDRSNYGEWEFIYDYTQDRSVLTPGQNPQNPQNPQSPQTTPRPGGR